MFSSIFISRAVGASALNAIDRNSPSVADHIRLKKAAQFKNVSVGDLIEFEAPDPIGA
jgi:hypothetical protein